MNKLNISLTRKHPEMIHVQTAQLMHFPDGYINHKYQRVNVYCERGIQSKMVKDTLEQKGYINIRAKKHSKLSDMMFKLNGWYKRLSYTTKCSYGAFKSKREK